MSLLIDDRTISGALREKIAEISGENVGVCYQCGTCSGSCPMTRYLESLPRRTMALAQLGHEEALLDADTPWVCASCHLCAVRCPRGIDLPRVMEAIRQIKLRKNINQVEPRDVTPERLRDLPTIAMVACFRKMTS